MTSRKQRLFQTLTVSLVLGLIGAVSALVFLAWLADEVMEGDTHHFDDVTRTAVHQLATPGLTSTMQGISFLGSTLCLTFLTVMIVLWFWLRRWKREAVLFAITMVGASLLDVTLKLSFRRARPSPYFDLMAPKSYSFPSGHALASFCFYGALAAILATRMKSTGVTAVLWITSMLLVLLIGFSRIYLGVHYTTDVVAGYTAALIWIIAIRFVEGHIAKRRTPARDLP